MWAATTLINNEGNNRMADEQLQAEATAPEEIQIQTPVVGSEQSTEVGTPTAPETPTEPDRGDPRIAMQEERKRRQEIERNLNDPNFIYERARLLGLAADETPSTPPSSPTPQPAAPAQPDVASIVEHQLDYFRTIEKHPEFDREKGDQGLVKWAATLVNDGHRPSEAVDIILKTIQKQAAKLTANEVSSTLEARATSEALKLSADAITSTAQASSSSDDEELNAKARNWKDPQAQQEAILEKLRRGVR